MRILFVSGLTNLGLGGAQAEAATLVRGMASRGTDIGMAADHPIAGAPTARHFALEYPPADKAPGQVRAALDAFLPDIVHVIGGGIAFLRRIDAAVGSVPWLFTAHNVPPAERTFQGLHGFNGLYYLARDARALPSMAAWRIFLRAGRFRGVVAHSDVVAERLRHCGCPAHKVHKIPFGFDVPELPANGASPFPEHASPKILSVGGLVHHKGLHDLVRAMPGLRRSFPRAHLCIVGERRDKAYAAYLERLIARQRAQHCVSLLGDATEATKAAALRDADLYVQASHEEGFCLAFAEAAAIVPRLVGTRTGEIAGLAQGDELAVIVEPRKNGALLQAMTEVLSAKAATDVVTRRRDRLAARYSWHSYFDRHFAAYAAILA